MQWREGEVKEKVRKERNEREEERMEKREDGEEGDGDGKTDEHQNIILEYCDVAANGSICIGKICQHIVAKCNIEISPGVYAM